MAQSGSDKASTTRYQHFHLLITPFEGRTAIGSTLNQTLPARRRPGPVDAPPEPEYRGPASILNDQKLLFKGFFITKDYKSWLIDAEPCCRHLPIATVWVNDRFIPRFSHRATEYLGGGAAIVEARTNCCNDKARHTIGVRVFRGTIKA
jgi:hypothetical protein